MPPRKQGTLAHSQIYDDEDVIDIIAEWIAHIK